MKSNNKIKIGCWFLVLGPFRKVAKLFDKLNMLKCIATAMSLIFSFLSTVLTALVFSSNRCVVESIRSSKNVEALLGFTKEN